MLDLRCSYDTADSFSVSKLCENMDSLFVTNLHDRFEGSSYVGRFHVLGRCENSFHFYILKIPIPKYTKLKVNLPSKFSPITNCSRYDLVTEVGGIVGGFFEAAIENTTIYDWYCLINNSGYGHNIMMGVDSESVTMGVSDNKIPFDISDIEEFELIPDSDYYGCLMLFSKKGDMCIVSTHFDDVRFSTIEL